VNFCLEIVCKHAYNCCMKCCLLVNNYKHGDGASFEVISDKCNFFNVCYGKLCISMGHIIE
jgi:hypothetical protein